MKLESQEMGSTSGLATNDFEYVTFSEPWFLHL